MASTPARAEVSVDAPAASASDSEPFDDSPLQGLPSDAEALVRLQREWEAADASDSDEQQGLISPGRQAGASAGAAASRRFPPPRPRKRLRERGHGAAVLLRTLVNTRRCCTAALVACIGLMVFSFIHGVRLYMPKPAPVTTLHTVMCNAPEFVRAAGVAAVGGGPAQPLEEVLLPWPKYVESNATAAHHYVVSHDVAVALGISQVLPSGEHRRLLLTAMQRFCDAMASRRAADDPTTTTTTTTTTSAAAPDSGRRLQPGGSGSGRARPVHVQEVLLQLTDPEDSPVPGGRRPWQHGNALPLRSDSGTPRFPMDESYTLRLADPQTSTLGYLMATAVIRAPHVWGLMRGLVTLRQLVLPSGVIAGAPVFVEDQPEFMWRGLMVDVSRHYMPMAVLDNALEGMEQSKLNTLHLHITDAQSFPMVLESYPQLAAKGAYSSDQVYTRQDMQQLVANAAGRGIRVLPEVDVPAHVASWAHGVPGIVARCDVFAKNFTDLHDMDLYVLDPTQELTYTVVEAVITEFANIFPDDFLHLGGDELRGQCWDEVPHIRQYMQTHELDAAGLQLMFVKRVRSVVERLSAKMGKSFVVWQGLFHAMTSENLPPDLYAVEPWMCWDYQLDMTDALRHQHGVVQSACNYLDYTSRWDEYNQNHMTPFSNFEETSARLYLWGGEAAIWAENVDYTNFDCRVWPRAAVVAERLWSSLPEWESDSLYPRLLSHRQRLVEAGVEAAELPPMLSSVSADAGGRRRASTGGKAACHQPKLHARVAPAHRRASAGGAVYPRPMPGAVVPPDVAAQCFPFDRSVQRPVVPVRRTVVQFNVDEGGMDRLDDILTWLRARQADVVGLCELVGWADDTLLATKVSGASLSNRAGKAGFAYAAMLDAPSGFNIGIMATKPITVLSRDVANFERGMLEVDIDGEVYIVVHLHAHDAVARAREAHIVAHRVANHTADGRAVLVMGDMNTLSPRDAAWHQQEHLLHYLQQPTTPSRLRTKYLRTVDGKAAIDYRPMATLLEHGLHDLCTVTHWDKPGGNHTAPSPCLFTEPTSLSMVPESPQVVPPFRLDYALGNGILRQRYPHMQCAVVQTADTQRLSDHFPIECRTPV